MEGSLSNSAFDADKNKFHFCSPDDHNFQVKNMQCYKIKQARKPRSCASLKLRPTHLLTYLLTRVKCRATSVAKKGVKL